MLVKDAFLAIAAEAEQSHEEADKELAQSLRVLAANLADPENDHLHDLMLMGCDGLYSTCNPYELAKIIIQDFEEEEGSDRDGPTIN